MNELSSGLVEETQGLLRVARGSLAKVAENLYRIKDSKEWEQYESSSWGSFCEGILGISESQASKLVSNYTAYIIEGGLTLEQIEGVDYEKLNSARSLSGTVEEKLAKAQTLSRAELKAEKVDDGHIHSGKTYTAHACCNMRIETNG